MSWKNKKAIEALLRTAKSFGRPKIYSPARGGIAIWSRDQIKRNPIYKKKNCLNEIMIRDEAIVHLCPMKHVDFLYTAIKVDISPSALPSIIGLSGSIIYDPLKKKLVARCGSLNANIATLKVATDVLTGKTSLDQVRQKGLYPAALVASGDEEKTKAMYDQLCINLHDHSKKYSKKHTGFWSGAFTEKCKSVVSSVALKTKEAFQSASAGVADVVSKIHPAFKTPVKVHRYSHSGMSQPFDCGHTVDRDLQKAKWFLRPSPKSPHVNDHFHARRHSPKQEDALKRILQRGEPREEYHSRRHSPRQEDTLAKVLRERTSSPVEQHRETFHLRRHSPRQEDTLFEISQPEVSKYKGNPSSPLLNGKPHKTAEIDLQRQKYMVAENFRDSPKAEDILYYRKHPTLNSTGFDSAINFSGAMGAPRDFSPGMCGGTCEMPLQKGEYKVKEKYRGVYSLGYVDGPAAEKFLYEQSHPGFPYAGSTVNVPHQGAYPLRNARGAEKFHVRGAEKFHVHRYPVKPAGYVDSQFVPVDKGYGARREKKKFLSSGQPIY